MRFKWLPWRFLMSRIARSCGFLDPIPWLNRLRGFAHPSEVTEPVELLRAGVLFHARGLINTKAIQHNLDWIWPFWAERQFNPADNAFVPRAFSFSHINLTHRNWTAVGLPNVPFYPIVDPHGLVTPFHDSWSLDFWLLQDGRTGLFPSKLKNAKQTLDVGENLVVRSRFEITGAQLETDVSMEKHDRTPMCLVRVRAKAAPAARLVITVRPYNPEGVSFIDSIEVQDDPCRWLINDEVLLEFGVPPEQTFFSNYRVGDVLQEIESGKESTEIKCAASMASGAAVFKVEELNDRPLEIRVPVLNELTRKPAEIEDPTMDWTAALGNCSRLEIPDPLMQELYERAVASLILHTPGEVYPGPYTYKRFWYRDAAFILNALITIGEQERVKKALHRFPRGQTLQGYFRSQEGEWDSNGEVLWILQRYLELTGTKLPSAWEASVISGAKWIVNKRLPKTIAERHAGLLPAGFSAEHLGPNDFYYWDDFWAVAGLRSASMMLRLAASELAEQFADEARDLFETIVQTFAELPTGAFRGAISASPYRRMDAGAIGSLVADYPLRLFPPGDDRILKTAEYLNRHSSFEGGFFQNMIHSGINAYLTLHLAQVFLRAGNLRALDLMDVVARLASPTGQWPEAIHPRTGGGCMGDGQHIWASAEWVMMMRNLFVREEKDRLVVGSGLFPRWTASGKPLSFGPTLTPWGPVSVRWLPDGNGQTRLKLDGEWRNDPPEIEIRVPGHKVVASDGESNSHVLKADS